jgi:hypothetical protein
MASATFEEGHVSIKCISLELYLFSEKLQLIFLKYYILVQTKLFTSDVQIS